MKYLIFFTTALDRPTLLYYKHYSHKSVGLLARASITNLTPGFNFVRLTTLIDKKNRDVVVHLNYIWYYQRVS